MNTKHLSKLLLLCLSVLIVCCGCVAQVPTTPAITESTALVPQVLANNKVTQNPYLSTEEASIHNDIYNSDVTAKAMPLGIYSEIAEAVTQDSVNSPPAFFYDNNGNAIVPYNKIMDDGSSLGGGIAIKDVDSPDLETKGSFLPYLDDNQAKYGIQISYSFVDKNNYLVGPTTSGHIVMIKTADANGKILPTFEKKLDVDIVAGAIAELGGEIDQNLLSLAYDYSGNIWFVTGGFHKNPAYSKAGFCGYLEREYVERCLAGETKLDLQEFTHYMKLNDGENAENGIAAHPEGCVILTNQACYLLEAQDEAINERWSVPYESSGGKGAVPESGISGAGLAWGGGSSPTLTDNMVLFTDNQDVVNLYAVDIKNGEILVTTPVLDLGEDIIVSVENSISVYAADSDNISVLVCNWFGAGNAGLFAADADSSLQSYDNLYDANWRQKGSAYLMPGVERIDIVKQSDGTYKAQQIWCRADLKDTSMIKLSTAAGYYYGYTQDETSGEWGFFALDYNSGATVLWMPVSAEEQYNDIAVGIMQGNNGNSIYCPTNSRALVNLRDRFVYLPDNPAQKLDILKMERSVLSAEAFQQASQSMLTPATYLMSAVVPAESAEQPIAFRVNGLSGVPADYHTFCQTAQGDLAEFAAVTLTDESGRELASNEKLVAKAIYELRISTTEAAKYDLDQSAENCRLKIIMAK